MTTEYMDTPCRRAALVRLVLMSWCWSFLVDFLWIPLVAYTQDLGLANSTAAGLFAVNLGARLVPNLAATLAGLRSELAMMTCVLVGYTVALLRSTELWALYCMAACSGMGFIRACLTLHPPLVFGDDDAELARAAKYCGAARNLGTLTALVAPVAVYHEAGWPGVCLLAIAAALLYISLAATQHILFGNRSSESERKPGDAEDPGTQAREAIPWILWVMGAAFVVLELQMNICNAAVPTALTQTFGLQITTAGHFLAFTNGASMCFLAWLPSAPRWLEVLHRSPLNILLAFFSIFAAWFAAMMATATPLLGGLRLFAPGVFAFMLAAYLAQVLMLECLTGVMEVRESKLLMGVSETVGCAFAALGGYLGDELEIYGAAAPFALQASLALVTATTMAGCLGHRLVTQSNASKQSPEAPEMEQEDSWVRQSLSGLQAMRDSPSSFVACEREYRRWRARARSRGLNEPLLAAEAEGGGTSPASTTADSTPGACTDSPSAVSSTSSERSLPFTVGGPPLLVADGCEHCLPSQRLP